jgi:hypothetical protein
MESNQTARRGIGDKLVIPIKGRCLVAFHHEFGLDHVADIPGAVHLEDVCAARQFCRCLDTSKICTSERRRVADSFPEIGVRRGLLLLFEIDSVPQNHAAIECEARL